MCSDCRLNDVIRLLVEMLDGNGAVLSDIENRDGSDGAKPGPGPRPQE